MSDWSQRVGTQWHSPITYSSCIGQLEIYRIQSTVAFLHSGSLLHAISPRSQCWCVDGFSKFVIKVLSGRFYRIELPAQTEQDCLLVERFVETLQNILRYERTPCPFKRDRETSPSPLPSPAVSTKKSVPIEPAKRWRHDGVWRPEHDCYTSSLSRQHTEISLQRTEGTASSSSREPISKVAPYARQRTQPTLGSPVSVSRRSITAPPALGLHRRSVSSPPGDLQDAANRVSAVDVSEANAFGQPPPLSSSQDAPTREGDRPIDTVQNISSLIDDSAHDQDAYKQSSAHVSTGSSFDISYDSKDAAFARQASELTETTTARKQGARPMLRQSLTGLPQTRASTQRPSKLHHRTLSSNIVAKSCSIFLAPPAQLVGMMVRIAAHIAVGALNLKIRTPTGTHKRVPGSWHLSDDSDNEEGVDSDDYDIDDYGFPIVKT